MNNEKSDHQKYYKSRGIFHIVHLGISQCCQLWKNQPIVQRFPDADIVWTWELLPMGLVSGIPGQIRDICPILCFFFLNYGSNESRSKTYAASSQFEKNAFSSSGPLVRHFFLQTPLGMHFSTSCINLNVVGFWLKKVTSSNNHFHLFRHLQWGPIDFVQ